MTKPYFKLTAKELKDTENCLTSEPFNINDPDVKVYKLKNSEKFGPFTVKNNLKERKNNMDIKDKKPRDPKMVEAKVEEKPAKSIEQM